MISENDSVKFNSINTLLESDKDISTVKIQSIGLNTPEVYEKFISSELKNEFPDFKSKILSVYHKISENKDLKFGKGPSPNYFFNTIYLAYIFHGELILSPDEYWLAIQQQFAMYVEKNSEKLRKKIVDFDGKMNLIVKFSYLDPRFKDIYSSSFRWDIFTEEFSKLIMQNTKGNFGKSCVSDFTTTGSIEKSCSEVFLMHTCKNYFKYVMKGGGCGISQVSLLGKLEDWKLINKKLEELKVYVEEDKKMVDWLISLQKITDSFIETYNGKPDLKFWNSVIDKKEVEEDVLAGSGYMKMMVEYFTGWIKHFFIYDKDGKFILGKESFQYKDLPLSYVTVPVKLKYDIPDSPEYNLDYVAGFTSVRVDEKYRVRTNLSVAFAINNIAEKKEKKEKTGKTKLTAKTTIASKPTNKVATKPAAKVETKPATKVETKPATNTTKTTTKPAKNLVKKK